MIETTVKLISSLEPERIPSGSVGQCYLFSKIGLNHVVFENGEQAFVFARDVEVLSAREIKTRTTG